MFFYRHPGVLFRGLRFGTVWASQLCGFRQLLLHQPLRQQHRVRRVDAEEDVQDLRLLLPGLDPAQGVVLLRTLSLLDKGGLDAITCAHLTIGLT